MMMKKHKMITRWAKASLCLMGLFLFVNIGIAQQIPARPNPPRLVNDFANILSDSEIYALETKLTKYNDTTSTQICVVTVTTLDGTDSNDFAQKLGEKWGVGHKENNGAVILVLPKTDEHKGDVAIQVGYGLEPYLPDAVCKRIEVNIMLPAFFENDYFGGINMACDEIIRLASGAFKAKGNDNEADDVTALIVLVASIFFIAAALYLISKKGNKNRGDGSQNGGKNGKRHNFWKGLLWAILLSGGGRGGWGSSGGSWGGGHSSGGFGGFGGGHFGGGGASTKW